MIGDLIGNSIRSYFLLNLLVDIVNGNCDFQVNISKHKPKHHFVKNKEKADVDANKHQYDILNIGTRYLQHD